MSLAFANASENPYDDNVVIEPREVHYSVPGLNQAQLDALVKRIDKLDATPAPRAQMKRQRAELIVSPSQGYGKSHLLGRLFVELGERTIPVYLNPFQDPFKAWHSLLLAVVKEISRPRNSRQARIEPMALSVLASLGASYIERADEFEPKQAASYVAYLRRLATSPQQICEQKRPWIEWLASAEPKSEIVKQLRNADIGMEDRAHAWVSVFAALALGERDGAAWLAALKWLRAEPLEDEEAQALGLVRAENDAPDDASPQTINDLAYNRLKGLCTLAAFYRPFLFCFDQTEAYVGDPALIIALGKCVERLFADLPNHLTVITANQANWLDDIEPYLGGPAVDRIGSHITLDGIDRDGAQALYKQRMLSAGFEPSDIALFLNEKWLGAVFELDSELSVRRALKAAARRFREFAEKPPAAEPTIEDGYAKELATLRADPARQAYDQDALMWFVKNIGAASPEVTPESTKGPRYFSLQWTLPNGRVVFAFEATDKHLRWQAIAREASALASAGGKSAFAAYVFRTPDLDEIPKPSWPAVTSDMDRARTLGFQIWSLDIDQVCELHAARALHASALQGDTPFGGAETLGWLQRRFAAFVAELAKPPTRRDPPQLGLVSTPRPAQVEAGANVSPAQAKVVPSGI